ncbi:MAG: VCBS repeat-containing protein [Bacteroidota bacterium]
MQKPIYYLVGVVFQGLPEARIKNWSLALLLVGCLTYASSAQPVFKEVSRTHLPEEALSGNNSMDAFPVDIDADGDLDLVIAVEFYKNMILLNNGKGQFKNGSGRLPDPVAEGTEQPYPYYPHHDSEDVAVADFDHDGDLDIVIVTEDDQVNEYYGNRGDGTFEDWGERFPVTGVTNGLLAADLDGDGWTDLVLANNGQNEYLRNAEGTWLVETAERLPTVEDITQDVEAADYDSDGDLDIIVGNELDNRLLRNDGTGHFTDVTEELLPAASIGEETREADFGDVNGDGRLDLYFANVTLFQQRTPVPRLLIQQPNGTFADESEARLDINPRGGFVDADLVDVDADGDLDLVLAGMQGPQLHLNDGTGHFKDVTWAALRNAGQTLGVDVEVADFNGDGKMDLYLGNFRGADKLFLQE